MKIPSAKEKDFVLKLYFNRNVKGIAPPKEENCPRNFREIEAILNDDGYIVGWIKIKFVTFFSFALWLRLQL